ncbi:MAG: hypothetical protein COB66_00695 [Coxiella sp. (in: Bacteria)]|nr:MAG: hypothetical protein COB66_00695 [Coxiella sp. (in: g-proteobacteria)]
MNNAAKQLAQYHTKIQEYEESLAKIKELRRLGLTNRGLPGTYSSFAIIVLIAMQASLKGGGLAKATEDTPYILMLHNLHQAYILWRTKSGPPNFNNFFSKERCFELHKTNAVKNSRDASPSLIALCNSAVAFQNNNTLDLADLHKHIKAVNRLAVTNVYKNSEEVASMLSCLFILLLPLTLMLISSRRSNLVLLINITLTLMAGITRIVSLNTFKKDQLSYYNLESPDCIQQNILDAASFSADVQYIFKPPKFNQSGGSIVLILAFKSSAALFRKTLSLFESAGFSDVASSHSEMSLYITTYKILDKDKIDTLHKKLLSVNDCAQLIFNLNKLKTTYNVKINTTKIEYLDGGTLVIELFIRLANQDFMESVRSKLEKAGLTCDLSQKTLTIKIINNKIDSIDWKQIFNEAFLLTRSTADSLENNLETNYGADSHEDELSTENQLTKGLKQKTRGITDRIREHFIAAPPVIPPTFQYEEDVIVLDPRVYPESCQLIKTQYGLIAYAFFPASVSGLKKGQEALFRNSFAGSRGIMAVDQTFKLKASGDARIWANSVRGKTNTGVPVIVFDDYRAKHRNHARS